LTGNPLNDGLSFPKWDSFLTNVAVILNSSVVSAIIRVAVLEIGNSFT
jgi:hypothetical protein